MNDYSNEGLVKAQAAGMVRGASAGAGIMPTPDAYANQAVKQDTAADEIERRLAIIIDRISSSNARLSYFLERLHGPVPEGKTQGGTNPSPSGALQRIGLLLMVLEERADIYQSQVMRLDQIA